MEVLMTEHDAAQDQTLMANAIRALAMDAVETAKSGHPGMPMGCADIMTVLFSNFMKFDPGSPRWPDRDRFVLSAGHGSMLLYATLHLTGYKAFALDQLKRFRQLSSLAAGHPEFDLDTGIETTTGPLGQGMATAVGMAFAEQHMNARFGNDLVDHYTYVLASDGDLMEGVSHEAASLAGHLGLSRLIVLYDDNEISIDGPTSLSFSDDTRKRFEAYGWHTQKVDGHKYGSIYAAIAAAQQSDKPSLIACRTQIGFGAPTKAGKSSSHGSPLGAQEIEGARANLNWPHEPFELPARALSAWRRVGAKGSAAHAAWQARHDAADAAVQAAFDQAITGEISAATSAAIAKVKAAAFAEPKKLASRAASGEALEQLVPAIPVLVGGSADLTGSNNTRVKASVDIEPGQYEGNYVRYGVREHGMAAAMNGMALHGGVVPYSGTFLVFSDYCRPSLRLAALMGIRVVHVMTHDSIGLGEDGPTHQPVEHLAALRAIPNLLVFRPADRIEVAECWEAALLATTSPSVMALSRQGLPQLRAEGNENKSAKGGYILLEAEIGPRQITLLATGSEVTIAADARALLEADGIGTAVVSMPCWALFDAQDADYRDAVLGPVTGRVAVEAAVRQGWDRYIGSGTFVGMSSFGASAPADVLYKHFGITAGAVADAARALLA
jgi:transketolase